MRNEERDPERGTRIRNEERNGVITWGCVDPPCVHMGGRVTLFLDVKLGVNVPGTTLSVTGNHVMY